MTEAPVQDSIQETSELTFMKSKFPLLKQKLSQPFPYFYALAPKDQSLLNEKLAEIKAKIKEDPQLPEHKDIFQAIALGRIQGMPATSTPLDVLSKYFEFDNKEFWVQFTKQKVGQKFYGLPKQKSHCLWQIKDLELVKEMFNIQQAKKQRKIVKQYSNFYKAGSKFCEKFQKMKNQNDVTEAYEQYKKVEQEDSKMNKILTTEKNKSTKIIPQVQIQPAEKPEKVEQKQKEQPKPEVIQQEINKPQVQINQANKIPEPKPQQQKPNKKKTQPKQQASNKKENKGSNDKQQQLLSQHKPLDFFFKKKAKEPQQAPQDTEMKEQQKVDKTDVFIANLGFKKQPCETTDNLKEQFRNFKKKMDTEIKICYVTINMLRSRLELQNFAVKDTKVDFLDPFGEMENIRYDDSSDEYSELVADSINQQMVQEEEEEQEEESNSAIVSDSFCEYKSSHVLSSSQSQDESQEIKMKPEMSKSVGKWFFSCKEVEKRQKYAKYDMVCLEETFPIIVKDQAQESSNDVSSAQKVEMYRQIHGSYTSKQTLIKKLNSIVENKISMNKLSTLIKDICEKKGSQRVLKPEMIKQLAEELAQLNPNLEAELEQIRNERQTVRNIETQAKRQQKMNEKDQKIEKLILQYEGQITTSSLLQYLRSKEVKILKQELNSIIKTKQGEKWEEIRNQIKKSKLIKKSRTKKIKVKPSKNQNEQNLMNTHRPIDEILKQNQIDNMNKPKKEKKPIEQGEMVDQGAVQVEQEQEYIDPEDDESFELNNKRKKKKEKSSKNKKIVKISPLLPPVRRNPKRNKKKSKKYNQQQQVGENANQINNDEMEEDNQNEEAKDASKSEENLEKQGVAKIDEEMIQQNEEAQNRSELPNQNEESPQKEKKQQVLASSVQEKNVSPLRIVEEPQKKMDEGTEKTANKIGPCEPGVESN